MTDCVYSLTRYHSRWGPAKPPRDQHSSKQRRGKGTSFLSFSSTCVPAFGKKHSWNSQGLWHARNTHTSRMLLWTSATAQRGSPITVGSCLVCRQEQLLAQCQAPMLDSLELFCMSFPCNIYFPQVCSGLHSPQQGSEICVIVHHFVQDKISL